MNCVQVRQQQLLPAGDCQPSDTSSLSPDTGVTEPPTVDTVQPTSSEPQSLDTTNTASHTALPKVGIMSYICKCFVTRLLTFMCTVHLLP